MASTKKMQEKAKMMRITSRTEAKKLGLRYVNFKDIAKTLNAIPEDHALLVDLGDTYGVYGDVADLVKQFYEEQDTDTCLDILARALAAAELSGAKSQLVYEWGAYNMQRRGFRLKPMH